MKNVSALVVFHALLLGAPVFASVASGSLSGWEFEREEDARDWMGVDMAGLARAEGVGGGVGGVLTAQRHTSGDPRLFLTRPVPLPAGKTWHSLVVRLRQVEAGGGERRPAAFDAAGTIVTFNGGTDVATNRMENKTWKGKGAYAEDEFRSTLVPDGDGHWQLFTVSLTGAGRLKRGDISEIRIDPAGHDMNRHFEIDYIRLYCVPAASPGEKPELAALPPVAALPSDWIDPETGRRIIRLSPDTGGESLYFHQRAYTPEGDKIVLNTPRGVVAVDISTLGVSPPRHELILPGGKTFATAWQSRETYINRDDAVVAIHLDTKAEREVVKIPAFARTRQIALNADETLLFGVKPDPDGKVIPRRSPSGQTGTGSFYENWAAGKPTLIYTLGVKTGKYTVIHRENDWTNHLQASPTDPLQILFCHEGPWHYVDRIWSVRADGKPARPLHERMMNMEIAGHEFFSHDGKTVWYDLQTPISGVFWLAGVNLETGRRVWYNHKREEWSVHYNVSPDGTLFAGDGGGPRSVAASHMDGTPLPGANGQWIYLFRPVMARGSSFRDQKELIDVGYFQSERLVDMSRHDYDARTGVEPNLTFTPDGKWIVFSGNFHSPRIAGRAVSHTYAVEVTPRRN